MRCVRAVAVAEPLSKVAAEQSRLRAENALLQVELRRADAEILRLRGENVRLLRVKERPTWHHNRNVHVVVKRSNF